MRAVADTETEAAVAAARAVADARAAGPSVPASLQTKGVSAKKNKQKGKENAQRVSNQKKSAGASAPRRPPARA